VPSGVWHEDEYAKLRRYDLPIAEQPVATFMCHQGDGGVCSGWLGHADPSELLAVRIGIIEERLDPSCASYTTSVPLFASGAEAADHGEAEMQRPSDDAIAAVRKIVRVRSGSASGPVEFRRACARHGRTVRVPA